MSPISIFSLTRREYVQAVVERFGKGKVYAERIYSHWFTKGSLLPEVEPEARALVQEILAHTSFFSASLDECREEGEVKKFLLSYADALQVESVILPMKFGYTLCVSSQVGCRMGCAFCETGKMGLLRSLTVEEIVFQVFAARFILNKPIRNLVFMGMGEPFDNYDNVMQAIRVLASEGGLGIPFRKITVSTSGKVAEIRRFADEADPSLRLALSLNAPNDGVRGRLMPVNKTADLAALRSAMEYYVKHPKREILVEYVLLQGINDSLEDAKEVGEFLKGLPVRINLIPYNAQSRGCFLPPSEETLRAFQRALREQGYSVFLRLSRGRAIMAACGQLGNKEAARLTRKLYRLSSESSIGPIL